eukprot:TRINITY_DN190_c0_g2_i1.p1 TRINITY_DN190_c0_g2~~TRINITY_DN190_c0_g2_i1.p1  ORF type:complete len:706 (+),score=134.12 TRINITY_DN190_c0_g2_i1:91-2208(+)
MDSASLQFYLRHSVIAMSDGHFITHDATLHERDGAKDATPPIRKASFALFDARLSLDSSLTALSLRSATSAEISFPTLPRWRSTAPSTNTARPRNMLFRRSMMMDRSPLQDAAKFAEIQKAHFFSPDAASNFYSILTFVRFGQVKRRYIHIDQTQGMIREFDHTNESTGSFHYTDLRSLEVNEADDRIVRLGFQVQSKIVVLFAAFDGGDERESFLETLMSLLNFCSILEMPQLLTDDVVFKQLKIFAGTWNMGATPPPEDMSSWWMGELCDLYAFGLQEASFEGKQTVTDSITEKEKTVSVKRDWKQVIQQNLGPDYCLLHENNLWGIRLTLFVHKKHVEHISFLESGTEATGIGNVLGNKGGVGAFFYLYETPICFINSHLAARKDRIVERGLNYRDILRGLRLGHKDVDIINQSHHLFWVGDLNYRVSYTFEEAVDLIQKEDWAKLVEGDQLKSEMARGAVFEGFREGPLNFPPTYRYVKGKNVISNKKGQAPSYCDRIMWKSQKALASMVSQNKIAPSMDIVTSDHRPLGAIFDVGIKMPFLSTSAPCCALFEMLDICITMNQEWMEQDSQDGESDDDQESEEWSVQIICPSAKGTRKCADWSEPLTKLPDSYQPDSSKHLFCTFLTYPGWIMHEIFIIAVSMQSKAPKRDVFAGQATICLSEACQPDGFRFSEELTFLGRSLGTITALAKVSFRDSSSLR